MLNYIRTIWYREIENRRVKDRKEKFPCNFERGFKLSLFNLIAPLEQNARRKKFYPTFFSSSSSFSLIIKLINFSLFFFCSHRREENFSTQSCILFNKQSISVQMRFVKIHFLIKTQGEKKSR